MRWWSLTTHDQARRRRLFRHQQSIINDLAATKGFENAIADQWINTGMPSLTSIMSCIFWDQDPAG